MVQQFFLGFLGLLVLDLCFQGLLGLLGLQTLFWSELSLVNNLSGTLHMTQLDQM